MEYAIGILLFVLMPSENRVIYLVKATRFFKNFNTNKTAIIH
jgi:hypothetical protein